jgi:predicted dehydrogenase
VGAGSIADSKHLAGYSRIDGVSIAAVCDPKLETAQALAQKYGAAGVYSDYQQMIEEVKPDFISVCSPNFLHAEIAEAALQKGIHVHLEKPAARDPVELESVMEAAQAGDALCMPGLNNRFTDAAIFIKDYVQSGALGEIYHARCGWRRRRGIPGKGGWFTDKARSGGGPLIDLGSHYIDLALWFMGMPAPVSVSGQTYARFAEASSRNGIRHGTAGSGVCDTEDYAAGFARLDNGATLSMEFAWAANVEREHRYVELLGDRGGLFFDGETVRLFYDACETQIDAEANVHYSVPMQTECAYFVECIRAGRQPSPSLDDARKVLTIVDGLYRSSRTGLECSLCEKRSANKSVLEITRCSECGRTCAES